MQSMHWRNITALSMVLCLPAIGQGPKRMIDRCAQDGRNFWIPADGKTTIDWDGIGLSIEADPKGDGLATLRFSHEGHELAQKVKSFEAARGWLVVSPSAFAVTWNINVSAAYTQIFGISPAGEIAENTELIRLAKKTFVADAKQFCRDPGANAIAIKWIDDDRLLLSIDAWSSGFCNSNFTEGFILKVAANRIERKLSERELINLPAVCTWNVVPLSTTQRREVLTE